MFTAQTNDDAMTQSLYSSVVDTAILPDSVSHANRHTSPTQKGGRFAPAGALKTRQYCEGWRCDCRQRDVIKIDNKKTKEINKQLWR